MAKIEHIKNKHGEVIYPVSKEDAIYDGNGVLLSTKIASFITRLVDNLANYYLKSETYTKAEVDDLIGAIQRFSCIVVSELPVASALTMGTIYLVPSEDPQAQNTKDEYITIRSGSIGSYTYSWEQIGSTAIDLSGYVTTEALNTELAKYTTTANLTTLLAAKQDTIADLSTIRSGAAAGATAYQKPDSGIPKTDLAPGIQTSLERADESAVRLYNAQSPNGMGYLVLEKDNAFVSQVTDTNTIYEVRYHFDISADFNVPSGSVLFFNGGIINGGANHYTLNGNDTLIMGDYVFENVSFDGTFLNENVVIDNHHFGTFVDLEGILHSFTKASLDIRRDIVQTTLAGNKPFVQVVIKGNGYTIKTPCLYQALYDNPSEFQFASIDNVVFDCSLQTSAKRMLHFWGTGEQKASVTNCVFTNASYYGPVFFEKCSNPVFEGNKISGTLDQQYCEDIFNSQDPHSDDFAVSFYNCKGFISCVGNRIHDVNVGAILATSPERYSDTTGEIKSNIIEDIAGGGIKGWGASIVYNFVISENEITNTDCFNTSGSAGVHNPTNKAAVNIHGFKNLLFFNNYVHDISYAGTLDFDGLQDESGTKTQNAGLGIKVIGNTLDKVTNISFNCCKDLEFCDNIVRDTTIMVGIQGTTNVRVCGNQIKQIANNYPPGTATPSIYNSYIPITFVQSSYFNDLGEVEISGNDIIGGNYADSFLTITPSATTTGKINIRNNISRSLNPLYQYAPLTYRCDDSLVPYIKTNDIEKNFVLKKDTMPLALIYAIENVGYYSGQYEEIKSIIISKTDSEYIGSQNILISRMKNGTAELTMVTMTISAKNPGSNTLVVPLPSSIRLNVANIRCVLLKLDNPTEGNYLITLKVAPQDARRWIAYQETDMTPITITV